MSDLINKRLFIARSAVERDFFCILDEEGFLVADLLRETHARDIVRTLNDIRCPGWRDNPDPVANTTV